MIYKIYIPTKNRAGNNYLNKLVDSINRKPILIVEPQERLEYEKIYRGKVEYYTLLKANMGSSYIHKVLFEKINKQNENAFIIDDDICNIYSKEKGSKRLNLGIKSINEALDFISSNSPYILTGSMFKQHQWLSETDFQDFGRPAAFVYIKGGEVTKEILSYFNRYDILKYRLKSDIMFACACLYKGLKIGLCGRYGFTTPDMCTSKGGCYTDYQTNQQELCSKEICSIVGSNFASIINRRGRVEVKIAWKKLYEAKALTEQNKLF